MFMMVIAHAHERCFLLQEQLDFRLYEVVLLFAGTQHSDRVVWKEFYIKECIEGLCDV